MKLHALWLPRERPDAPVLLYLHGARWDVLSSSFRMRRMHELGFSVLASTIAASAAAATALPSERMAYEDARAAWEWLRERHPDAAALIFGHSLGSAIAVQLATEVDDEAGVMVEGRFTSIPDVYSTHALGLAAARAR